MDGATTRRRSKRNCAKAAPVEEKPDETALASKGGRRRRAALKDLTNANDDKAESSRDKDKKRRTGRSRSRGAQKKAKKDTSTVSHNESVIEPDRPESQPSASIPGRSRSRGARKNAKKDAPTVGHNESAVEPDRPESQPSASIRRLQNDNHREYPLPSNYRPGSSYQYTGTADDIDYRDFDDPLQVTDYVLDMYDIFREKEAETSARPYLDSQPSITHNMRAILVDWLVEVHLKFGQSSETLYMAVNMVDRYLEREEIERCDLQLVGVTSLMIAAKYEEIYPLGLNDLVYICDNAYTRRDILDMETSILKALNYQVVIHSSHRFLVRFLKAAHADRKTIQIANMVLDETLISSRLLDYLPSQLAAAAVSIARYAMARPTWSPTLLKYARYSQEEVLPVAKAIIDERRTASRDLTSVRKKYSSSRKCNVANIVLTMP